MISSSSSIVVFQKGCKGRYTVQGDFKQEFLYDYIMQMVRYHVDCSSLILVALN